MLSLFWPVLNVNIWSAHLSALLVLSALQCHSAGAAVYSFPCQLQDSPSNTWLIKTLISFQVMRYENVNFKENNSLDPATLSPSNPREKWLRKRTHVKLRVSINLNIHDSYRNWVWQQLKWSLIS